MKRQLQNGFTLTEVLVVLLLIVVIMALGIAVMPGVLKASQLSTGGRQVYSTLNVARQMAIAQHTKVRVVFDMTTATNVYALTTNSIGSSPSGRWESLPDGISFTNGVIDTTNEYYFLSSPGDYIEFGPTGGASADYGVMIIDASGMNISNRVNIRVDQLLGRVTTVRP